MLIRQLLAEREISTQTELVRLLDKAGHRVTQATVSRDLAKLDVTKSDGGAKGESYVVVGQKPPADDGFESLRRVLEDYLEAAVPSGNLVVLKVRAATAGAVAAAIDAAQLEGVAGTLAGDDTVLVVAEQRINGKSVARSIMGILEG